MITKRPATAISDLASTAFLLKWDATDGQFTFIHVRIIIHLQGLIPSLCGVCFLNQPTIPDWCIVQLNSS